MVVMMMMMNAEFYAYKNYLINNLQATYNNVLSTMMTWIWKEMKTNINYNSDYNHPADDSPFHRF